MLRGEPTAVPHAILINGTAALTASSHLVPLQQLREVAVPGYGDVRAGPRASQPAALAHLSRRPPLSVEGIDVAPAHASHNPARARMSTSASYILSTLRHWRELPPADASKPDMQPVALEDWFLHVLPISSQQLEVTAARLAALRTR